MSKLYSLCSSTEDLRVVCKSSNGKTLEEALDLVISLPEEHATSILYLLSELYSVDILTLNRFYSLLLEAN